MYAASSPVCEGEAPAGGWCRKVGINYLLDSTSDANRDGTCEIGYQNYTSFVGTDWSGLPY